MTQQVAALERIWQHLKEINDRLQQQITTLDSKVDALDKSYADIRSRSDVLIDAIRAHQVGQQATKKQVELLDKEVKALARLSHQNQWELTNPDSGVKPRVEQLEEIVKLLSTERAQREKHSEQLSRNVRNLMWAIITAGSLWVVSQLPALIHWLSGVL